MNPLTAGERKHRLTIQRRVPSRTGMGAVTYSWQDVATIWGAVDHLSGQELFAAQQVQSKVTTRIRLLHLDGIRSGMRVRQLVELGSPAVYRYYGVDNVMPLMERRRELHLLCTSRESDGFRDVRD